MKNAADPNGSAAADFESLGKPTNSATPDPDSTNTDSLSEAAGMSVTDSGPGAACTDDSRNDIAAAIEQTRQQEAFVAYRDYGHDCRKAGEPLCFETRQPISGKDIKYVELSWLGLFGRATVFLPVIGQDMVWEWSDEVDDYVEVLADYKKGSNTCPNCGCRFHKRNRGWYRRPWSRSGGSDSCSLFCREKLDREYDNRRARERRAKKRGDRECAQCGETFEPRRTDSVYCSNRCRQKAYRRRVTDNGGGS